MFSKVRQNITYWQSLTKTNIFQTGMSFSKRTRTPVASLKHRRWRWGILQHMKTSLITINMSFLWIRIVWHTLLVLNETIMLPLLLSLLGMNSYWPGPRAHWPGSRAHWPGSHWPGSRVPGPRANVILDKLPKCKEKLKWEENRNETKLKKTKLRLVFVSSFSIFTKRGNDPRVDTHILVWRFGQKSRKMTSSKKAISLKNNSPDSKAGFWEKTNIKCL